MADSLEKIDMVGPQGSPQKKKIIWLFSQKY